jgi:hypothetical protein
LKSLTCKVPTVYPTELNLETTTICDSKCRYCGRKKLIESGEKTAKHMPLEVAKRCIDRLRELTRHIPDAMLTFTPVGAGEPLLNPDYFSIVKYARQRFPDAVITSNTNCIALDTERAWDIIRSGLDSMVLSVNFHSAELYRRENGVDKYEQVVRNVKNFLQLKGNRKPRAYVQILDHPENRPVFRDVMSFWKPYLNRNDHVTFKDFYDRRLYPRKTIKYTCYEPWSVISIDIESDVYACCPIMLTSGSKTLWLGHISDSTETLYRKLENIKHNLLTGKYGNICGHCGALDTLSKVHRASFFKQATKLAMQGKTNVQF